MAKKNQQLLLSQTRCAALLRVTVKTVHSWGFKEKKTQSQKKLYDFWEILDYRLLMLENKQSLVSLTDERKRLIKLQADKKEIELDHQKGLLVFESDCSTAIIQFAQTVQNTMRSLPSKLAPQLTNIKTREAFKILTKEIDDCLSQAAARVGRKIPNPAKKVKRK